MPGLKTMCVLTKLKIGDLEEKKQGNGNEGGRKRKSRGLHGGMGDWLRAVMSSY